MSVLILIAIVAGFTAVGLLTVLAFRQASTAHRQTATMMAALDSVARQLSSANHTLNGRLDGVSGELTRTLSESLQKTTQALTGSIGSVREETRAKIDEKFVQITERLGDLKATNERIMEFSRSLDDFQRVLQSPKLRGDFGEFTLEQMLANPFARGAVSGVGAISVLAGLAELSGLVSRRNRSSHESPRVQP